MGRKNHSRRWPRGEAYLESDREMRDGKVLKIFRQVDFASMSLIGGALSELEQSEEISTIKPARKAAAYLLDPRLMSREFNLGFLTGFQCGRVTAGIKKDKAIDDEGYDVSIQGVRLLSNNRRTIIGELDSERLRCERSSIYKIFGEAGIKGFSGNGHRHGHRHGHRDGVSPTIVLGNFDQPISKADEPLFTGRIQAAVDINLINANSGIISLGSLEVKTYSPS